MNKFRREVLYISNEFSFLMAFSRLIEVHLSEIYSNVLRCEQLSEEFCVQNYLIQGHAVTTFAILLFLRMCH
jgi:hypothetical protein